MSLYCQRTFIAVRKGTWIYTRLGANGWPIDHAMITRASHQVKKWMPWNLKNYYIEKMLNSRFDHKLYGIKPNHRCLSQHPTVSDDFPYKVITGRVIIKNNIESFTEDGVIFIGKNNLQFNQI